MSARNAIYAQSGGPTAVINASACGLIETARQHTDKIGKVFAARYGIIGALKEELIDTSLETPEAIAALRYTPGSAFGSCRYKLKNIKEDDSQYKRLIEVFAAHDIGYFFYNGGGDSQDTAHKISQLSQTMDYPLTCLGIPKTIDNDLPFTDSCPGFGSAAKYVATSILEAALDLEGMCTSSTKVFIMEVMGRHAGWLAAATGLTAHVKTPRLATPAPHIILFPEVPFETENFLEKVKASVEKDGYCVIVVSEGAKDKKGKYISESADVDAFGNHQLGGAAPIIAHLIKKHLGYKYHWALLDYLQRSARHLASLTDADQAYALGKAAIEYALQGENNRMLTIERQPTENYHWDVGSVELSKVANVERKMPMEFISEDGFGITQACLDYLTPLIKGESYPPYRHGLPQYMRLTNQLTEKKLAPIEVE